MSIKKNVRFWRTLYTKNLFKKKKRRYWVHPYIDDRLARGGFITFFSSLRENPDKLINYFRMSVQSFDELADKITDMIKSQDTCMRLCITPLEMLAVTLR
jgi:hypothetical protein